VLTAFLISRAVPTNLGRPRGQNRNWDCVPLFPRACDFAHPTAADATAAACAIPCPLP